MRLLPLPPTMPQATHPLIAPTAMIVTVKLGREAFQGIEAVGGFRADLGAHYYLKLVVTTYIMEDSVDRPA